MLASVSEAIHQIEHFEVAKTAPGRWRRRAMSRYRSAHEAACGRHLQRGRMVLEVLTVRGER